MKNVIIVDWNSAIFSPQGFILGVIPALASLCRAGYEIIVSDDSTPTASEEISIRDALELLQDQGVILTNSLSQEGTTTLSGLVGQSYVHFLGRRDWQSAQVIAPAPRFDELKNKLGLDGRELATCTRGARNVSIGQGAVWTMIASDLIAGKMKRESVVVRKTAETTITVAVNIDGCGEAKIATGIGFFDHMLEQISRHGGIDLDVKVAGDLHVDGHHTIEDTALALGEAIRKALGDKAGIGRYGFVLPMDECQCTVSLDLSGRAHLVFKGQFNSDHVGEFPCQMTAHFFQSLTQALGATLHIDVYGDNDHHKVECIFKAVARCLRTACLQGGDRGVPSTKGVL